MGYRRKRDEICVWRAKNSLALTKLGIPACIVQDQRRFLFAVQEGFDWQSEWKASWISDEQAPELLRLLEEAFGNGFDLVAGLRRRVQPAQSV